MYNHFSDTVSGRETVAAYAAEQTFIRKNQALMRSMATAEMAFSGVQKWASLSYMSLGMALYASLAFSCTSLVYLHRMSLSSLGFVLVQGEQMVRLGLDAINLVAKVEIDFVAMERLLEYARLEQELDYDEGKGKLDLIKADDEAAFASGVDGGGAGTGPTGASLELRHVWFRYQLYRQPVLRGISLSIADGSKVALTGRTG